ncbi:MAG: hypothetical protein EA001_03990, partial [Oscillatoriales cyanobacterium]
DFEGDQKILACAETFHHWVAIEAFEQAASFIYITIPELGRERLNNYLRDRGHSDYLLNCLEQLADHLPLAMEARRVGSIGVCYYYRGDYEQAIQYL